MGVSNENFNESSYGMRIKKLADEWNIHHLPVRIFFDLERLN
jgi:hypothetical protein